MPASSMTPAGSVSSSTSRVAARTGWWRKDSESSGTWPTDTSAIGASARAVAPRVEQVFIGRGPTIRDQQHFERKLYVIRKLFERELTAVSHPPTRPPAHPPAYVSSLSSRTLIYKGM